MIKSKTKGILFTTGILLVGIICGILLGGMLKGRSGGHHGPFDYPRHRSDAMLQRFSKELDLTPAQRDRMKALLADQKQAMNGLMREVRPKIDAQMEVFKTDVSAILNDQQRKKYDALNARDENRRKKFKQRHEKEEQPSPQ